MKFRLNKVGKVCRGRKKVFICESLQINAKKRSYEGIMVLTALYGAETWNMEATEKEIKHCAAEVSEKYV